MRHHWAEPVWAIYTAAIGPAPPWLGEGLAAHFFREGATITWETCTVAGACVTTCTYEGMMASPARCYFISISDLTVYSTCTRAMWL